MLCITLASCASNRNSNLLSIEQEIQALNGNPGEHNPFYSVIDVVGRRGASLQLDYYLKKSRELNDVGAKYADANESFVLFAEALVARRLLYIVERIEREQTSACKRQIIWRELSKCSRNDFRIRQLLRKCYFRVEQKVDGDYLSAAGIPEAWPELLRMALDVTRSPYIRHAACVEIFGHARFSYILSLRDLIRDDTEIFVMPRRPDDRPVTLGELVREGMRAHNIIVPVAAQPPVKDEKESER